MTDILDDAYESDLTDEEYEGLILISEHAVAKPLSPAAQAVFHAFNSKFDWVEDGVPGPQFEAIAAALRAAVEQVLPHEALKGCDPAAWERDEMRVQLLAIASELESL
jgi:hypothetical protein